MTIPNVDDLLLPFLKEIVDDVEHRIRDIIENLADNFDLTYEERNVTFSELSKVKYLMFLIWFGDLF